MAPKRSSNTAMKKVTKCHAMKRSRREEPDPRPAKFELVKMALRSPDTVIPSPEARELLLMSVDCALQGEQDGRHEYQSSISKMIEETLLNHRQHLEAELESKNKFLEDANERKAALDGQVKETEQAIEAKKQEIQEKKALKSQDEAAVKRTNADLEKAKAAERQLETNKGVVTSEQTKLTAVYEQCFTVLRDTALASKKETDKLLKPLIPMLKSMGADESMLKGLPAAFLKAPEARGEFDNMAMSAVDKLFAKAKTALEEKLASHAEEIAHASAHSTEAKDATNAASQKLFGAIELLGSAESERKELEKQLKVVNAELAKHEKKANETNEEVEGAEQKIRNFARVEEAFNFLNTYSTKKEVQPEAEQPGEGAAEEEEEEEEDEQMEQQFPAPVMMQEEVIA